MLVQKAYIRRAAFRRADWEIEDQKCLEVNGYWR